MADHDVACPGCGVVLPHDPDAAPPSVNASPECGAVFAEVVGFEFQHPVMLRYHQMCVDTYGAQHAGPTAPLIRTGYSLAGLWLALEQDFTGDDVRAVHQRMGKPTEDWPAFLPTPQPRGWPTIVDVAEAGVRVGSEAGHARWVRRWADAVWASWTEQEPCARADVRRMLAGILLGDGARQPALRALNGPAGAVHRLIGLLGDGEHDSGQA